jgi:hypothetical protein
VIRIDRRFNHRVPLDWLEELVVPPGGWPRFYLQYLDKERDCDRAPPWGRLADWADRQGAPPPELAAKPLVDALCITYDPALALAAARLLCRLRLKDEQLHKLIRCLDFDHPLAAEDNTGADPIQHHGWDEVFDVCLTLLQADPRVELTDLFRDYNSVLVSRQGWWRIYYRRLMAAHADGLLDTERLTERLRLGLDWAEQEDPEQLIGLARALIESPPAGHRLNDVTQRALTALGLRRGREGFDLILPLAERYLPHIYPFPRLRLLIHLDDLARGDDRHRTASLPGLAAQDADGLLELFARYFVVTSPESKGTLLQAITESPADLDKVSGLQELYTEDDPWHTELALYAAQLHDPAVIHEALGQLDAARNIFADLSWEQAILKAHRLGSVLFDHAEANVAIPALERLLQRFCLALASRGAEALPEYRDRLVVSDFPAGDELAAWWDEASGILSDLRRRPLETAGAVEAAITWLRRRQDPYASELRGGARLLHSRLREWAARIQSLSQACQSGGTLVYRRRLSKSPVFEAIRLLLEKEDLCRELDRVTHEPGIGQKTLEKLEQFARAEEQASVAHALGCAETLLVHLIERLRDQPDDSHSAILWGMLSCSIGSS